jgi:hypothetical protein
MKTFKLENEPKIKSGFITPENYFEGFSAKILQQLPNKEPKVISVFSRKKTWIYYAAAIIVLALTIPVYNNYNNNSSEIETLTLENYITYNSTVSDADLVSLLNENDIQKLNIDLDLEDKNLENELSSTTNMDIYLLK